MAVEKVVIPDDETQEQKQERLRKELEERKAKEAKEAQEAEERRKAEEEAARKKAEEEGDKGGSTGNGEEETEPEQVEIDGTLYTLDDNGNAVDDNGEIKFTKEQIDAMSDENANELDGDYIEAISKASGIVIKDEKGEPVKFEPTIEGFAKREAAVKALGEREGFAKGFNEFLANNPDIAALVEYKSKFGTIEGYSANVDYSKVEIKDDDNLLADLIYKAEIQKGTSPERAKRIVEFAKANNTLKDDATESLNWLRKTQESEIKAIREREAKEMQAELEKEIKENIGYYKENAKVISETLKRCNIWHVGGKHSPYIWLRCPNNMKSWEFFDYLLENAQVVGTPGSGFGRNGEGYFRLTSFGSRENTIEAMKRFEKLFK